MGVDIYIFFLQSWLQSKKWVGVGLKGKWFSVDITKRRDLILIREGLSSFESP